MSAGKPVRVLLADDHPVFRAGLRGVLQSAPDVTVVDEAEDGAAAVARIQSVRPDVAVLDLQMPKLSGIEVTVAAKAMNIGVKCVLLTAHTDEEIVNKALDAGVSGYILKDAAVSEILACVRQVHAGLHFVSPQVSTFLVNRRRRADALSAAVPGLAALTPAERRVLSLVATGQTSREIGDALFISPRTVEHHRASIALKLGLKGANALIAFAAAHRSELN